MIIAQYYYCVVNKTFPIKFYDSEMDEYDDLEFHCLMSKEMCELSIKHSDEPDDYRIIPVRVSYEI